MADEGQLTPSICVRRCSRRRPTTHPRAPATAPLQSNHRVGTPGDVQPHLAEGDLQRPCVLHLLPPRGNLINTSCTTCASAAAVIAAAVDCQAPANTYRAMNTGSQWAGTCTPQHCRLSKVLRCDFQHVCTAFHECAMYPHDCRQASECWCVMRSLRAPKHLME
jgi:hypothetical protein